MYHKEKRDKQYRTVYVID